MNFFVSLIATEVTLIDRLNCRTCCHTLLPHVPSSQVLLHQLLVSWGPDGFEAFVRRLQRKYAQQALAAAAAAEQHLADLTEWQPVTAGMFMWMKLKGEALLATSRHSPFVLSRQ